MPKSHQLVPPTELERAGITVFERGWLSSNNILIQGKDGPSVLVDSGYVSHADQTLNLVRSALKGQPLDLLLNTHLHSDHCGGNALLQSSYPELQTMIPPGLAPAVSDWDPVALTFEPTGQSCAPFSFEELLLPGSTLQLGAMNWQVHAAEGHDPHSVILFQPQVRVLISADALWENGFGVVFPELEGLDAFQDVANTLDIIEQLAPLTVIPGHGSIFQDVPSALSKARSRLVGFIDNPSKHKRHALKVLLKFKLLEWQQIHCSELIKWCLHTPYITQLANEGNSTPLSLEGLSTFLVPLLKELEGSGALRLEEDFVFNS